jgi:hypothetical protein
MEIPMLDEVEFEKASDLYRKGFHNHEVSLESRSLRFKELLDFYFEITGYTETEPNAILHHRIELYGENCERCGKPYRTNTATFCASCGNLNRNSMD